MITEKKSNQKIPFSKSKTLPVAGLIALLFFIVMACFINSIFLDKIILCSLIIGMVLFAKTLSEGNGMELNSDRRTYTDPS